MKIVIGCWFFVFQHFIELHVPSGAIVFTSNYQGQTVTGLVGSSVNFTWSFSGDIKKVIWGLKKDGTTAIETKLLSLSKSGSISPSVSPAYNGRVSGSRSDNASSGQAIFTLSSISKDDARYFGCQIEPVDLLNGNIEFDSVQLVVNEIPNITLSSATASYNERSPVHISCTASGIPDPDVKWIRNGIMKSSGKKTAFLTFNSINRSDDGQYTCRANNSVGNDVSHVTLVVHYPPTIQEAVTSAVTSWIGQTVTLKCVSDGVPTPTLIWYKPDVSQISNSTATEYTVNVEMNVDQDFGVYKCNANNGLTPADDKTVTIKQIKKPGSPNITSSDADIQATSLTVRWNPPADNGGSPITAYRVVVLKDVNITDPNTTSLSVGGLERDTEYTMKVFARNAVFEGLAGEKTMKTKFEGVPATAVIYDLPSEVTNDNITLKWRKPKNNGKEITLYTVYKRIVTGGKRGEWTRLENITDIQVRELKVKMEKGKVYEFVVTATNALGESLKEDGKIKRVLASGIPAAVEMSDIPSEVTDSTITLKWSEPQSYGTEITQYTVYQRIVTDGKPGEWDELKNITDVSVRELKVELEKGKVYEFVVTATNVHGESSKDEGNSKRVKAIGGSGGGVDPRAGDGGDDNGMSPVIYAGVAAAGVLLIIGIIVIIVLWKRKKTSSHDETSADELASANPYELEDGYQAVSRAAAENLQASGSGAEANYAQVDLSKKKKNRRPPTDEYAQVDKSKKTKKTPKKKPGELDYAELGDLRRELQVPAAPSGAAAAAAVRPPAYGETVYADIAQFGVPQPDPTYANVSKGEVVYSNVESM